jgi:hypothetical protein
MDVFSFRDRVVEDYGQFSRSFTLIKAPDLRDFVDGRYGAGEYWPSPLIQLNPSFVGGGSIGSLVEEGLLHPECSRIFRWGKDASKKGSGDGVELLLHRHQREAIVIARVGGSLVVISGTGSGCEHQDGSTNADLTRLEDNRQALNERLRSHDLGGKLRLSFRPPARDGSQQQGCQLLSRSHPLVVELADFVAERALSGLEPELAARASVIRTKAVTKRTQVLVLRLRHQLHQSRWTGSQYEALPDLLVEECLTAKVTGDGVEPLEGAAALELLEAPASGNLDPGQRQQWLQEAVAEIDALQPALAALAERRADLAEEDHRRVREASLRSGESLRMRFRCEPSLPVDVIGLIVLLPAPVL